MAVYCNAGSYKTPKWRFDPESYFSPYEQDRWPDCEPHLLNLRLCPDHLPIFGVVEEKR